MDVRATLAAIEKKYSRETMWKAGAGVLAVLLVLIFFAGRSEEYRSVALLSYFGNDAAMSGTPLLSASSAASIQLDDAHLQTLVNEFALYPGLRGKHAPDDAVTHLRGQLMLEQLDDHSLQILFTDGNEERSKEVTNALAESLQTYVVSRSDAPMAMAMPVKRPRAVAVPVAKAVSADVKTRLLREMNVLSARVASLQSTKDESLEESAGYQQKIAALESSRPVAVKVTETTAADPSAGVRLALRQQLAAEKARLASLHERYTDAYPDVQDARQAVEQLEAKLANLPAAPVPVKSVSAPNLYQKQLDALTAEESRVGEQLRRNEHDSQEVQERLAQVKTLLAEPSDVASMGASAATAPPMPAPPMPAPAPPARALGVVVGGAASTYPFRILQRAVTSVATAIYEPTVYASCGAGLAVLIGLFMAVMLLPRYDAVMKTAEDVRANLPAHVAYLGDVKRMES